MQMPQTDPDTLFEELLQDLPPETIQRAGSAKPLHEPGRSQPRSNACVSSCSTAAWTNPYGPWRGT